MTTARQNSASAGVGDARRPAPPLVPRKAAATIHRRTPQPSQYSIPREWPLVGPIMLLVVAMTALWARDAPPWSALACVVVAAGLAGKALVRRASDELSEGTPLRRIVRMLGTVAAPMLLFGTGMAIWQSSVGAPNSAALFAPTIVVCTLVAVLTSGRTATLILGTAALWLGMALVTANIVALFGLMLGMAAGIYAAMRRAASDREAQDVQLTVDRSQQRAELILSDFEQTRQGWFWETDRSGAITYVSETIGEVVGRSQDWLIGRAFTDLFVLDGPQTSERTLAFHLSTRSSFQDLAVQAAVLGGDERWWSINGLPVYDDNDAFQGFRGSGSDLTERRRSEQQVTRLAHYDALTGLANRVQMSKMLERILTARVLDARVCSVFLLDLDRFKQVNDTLGHPAGDALLTQVSQRLERVVDQSGRVGRLGGDEFQIIIPGRRDTAELSALAEQIIEALSQPYVIDGHRVMIGASLGIALSPDNGVTSEALIRNADLALYAAKDGGRGRHHFYAPDLHSDAQERRQLEQDLRDALSNGGLSLAYQPIVCITTEKIAGFEALLRWEHPTRGPQSPAKFIPIAEDAGLIAPIGEWALRTACRDMAAWPDNVRVAVNVSPLQFANPSLPAIVTSALAAAQVDPARLELEITESVFLGEDADTDAMFAALKRLGVRLALDDFGTGYSSLGYLKKAPFDKIKIDQSFVHGATMPGSRNGAIIASIVSLAEALGMETTAEGVETLDELDLVRSLGCSHVQGYIYEKPLVAERAQELLAHGLTLLASGPRAARPVRQAMLRRIKLDHGGEFYDATIRNVSPTGAMVAGLWNVPPGTVFDIEFAPGQLVTATARWCQEDRMGVEFAAQLALDAAGRTIVPGERPPAPAELRRAG